MALMFQLRKRAVAQDWPRCFQVGNSDWIVLGTVPPKLVSPFFRRLSLEFALIGVRNTIIGGVILPGD